MCQNSEEEMEICSIADMKNRGFKIYLLLTKFKSCVGYNTPDFKTDDYMRSSDRIEHRFSCFHGQVSKFVSEKIILRTSHASHFITAELRVT